MFENSQAFHQVRCYPGVGNGSAPDSLFQLRYDVYCKERAFVDPDSSGTELERDDYDRVSTHFAAFSVDDLLLGSVRLVTPEDASPFPFERYCALFPHSYQPSRRQCAEVSRLVVRRSHRRARADSVVGIPGFPLTISNAMAQSTTVASRGQASPMLLLRLYREMFRHSRRAGIRYWYAAMERALVHSLRRMGFQFDPIGPVSDYRGKVTPYLLDLEKVLPDLCAANLELHTWFDEWSG